MGMVSVTLGHEFAGVLDDGTPVAVQPNVSCGTCAPCLAGRSHLCTVGFTQIHGVSLDGGLAERAVVDPACLVPLDPTVDLSSAALVEPLAVIVHAFGRVAPVEPERVLVIGGGSLGVLAVALAGLRGWPVDLAARHPAQREAGRALGAGEPGDRGDYPLIVDTAASQSSLELAVERAMPGGTLLEVGTFWDPVQLTSAMGAKEITLVPALMYGHTHGRRDFDEAADALARRPELADVVVTHRFPLADAATAFEVAGQRAAGSIKVHVQP
jgi:threonine dehydrogenase-like Zn-dependent dehydrogenase